MSTLAIICMVVVPGLLVLAGAMYTLHSMLAEHDRYIRQQSGRDLRQISLPIRLQAYERLALLLERISPESLLLREETGASTCKEYEIRLHTAIRAEWNHNLSQQIYVSQETWDSVRKAKGNVSQLISLCAQRTSDESPANELAAIMLNTLLELDEHPTAQALAQLRNEAHELF